MPRLYFVERISVGCVTEFYFYCFISVLDSRHQPLFGQGTLLVSTIRWLEGFGGFGWSPIIYTLVSHLSNIKAVGREPGEIFYIGLSRQKKNKKKHKSVLLHGAKSQHRKLRCAPGNYCF